MCSLPTLNVPPYKPAKTQKQCLHTMNMKHFKQNTSWVGSVTHFANGSHYG